MAFKPILFSTPMVEAILNGRKTQTRRVVKYSKDIKDPQIGWSSLCGDGRFEVRGLHDNGSYGSSFFKMPICKDDILWVREAWNSFDSDMVPYVYRASDLKSCGHDWKPSIHMPFDAARIFLKVKRIRIERLNDISENDAIAEGIDNHIDDEGKHQFYVYPVKEKRYSRAVLGLALLCNSFISKGIFGLEEPAKFSFHSLWESINGMESWDLNPWVWVYEFEVLKTEPGTCISCGCIDNNCLGCIEKTGSPCSWTNSNHTVCSACRPSKIKS